MKNKVIYFDFDRTLLDTDSLKKEQEIRISRITSLTVEQVGEGMRKYIESLEDHLDFDPEGYAYFLEKLYGVNPSDVLKIYITDSNYIADFLFPNALTVLQKLKEAGFSLGIFSGAVPGHQRLKIERTGVFEFIERKLVIIEQRKLAIETLEKLPDGITVVDDDLKVVSKLQAHYPRFIPIWCNRKTKEELPKIRTIHSLLDLLEDIETI